MFTNIPATRGVLNCIDFRGTACSVATGWALLLRVGFTTALVVVGSACVIFVVHEKNVWLHKMVVNQQYMYPQLLSHGQLVKLRDKKPRLTWVKLLMADSLLATLNLWCTELRYKGIALKCAGGTNLFAMQQYYLSARYNPCSSR